MATHLHFKRKRLKTAGFILGLIFILLASAGLDARQNQSTAASKHCLWEVQTPASKVFLLGSLHLLKSDAYPLAAEINTAYRTSSKVVFETDIGAMEDPAVQARMLNMALYPEGQTLLQNIPDDMRRALHKRMSDIGLPMESFVRFKPWFIAVTLTALELQRLGFSPANGIDVHYYGRAQLDEKKLGFLEPIDYQLDLLGDMSADDQNSFLGQTLKDLEIAAEMAEDMMKYWKSGQTDKLYSLLFKSFEDYPEIKDRLLLQRNKDWVEKIETMLEEPENMFIVVGAGHLIGPNSVIALLKQKGYKVMQR
ncbi:MAG: TraB/GumN family protein [Desulfobacteraceae bacterium]|jgi:uncharacterized protein YbaP (TraB family)|nr:TraB/GumN family protein [Desulfobacteraceae bacterium]